MGANARGMARSGGRNPWALGYPGVGRSNVFGAGRRTGSGSVGALHALFYHPGGARRGDGTLRRHRRSRGPPSDPRAVARIRRPRGRLGDVPEASRFVATHIPGARSVELSSSASPNGHGLHWYSRCESILPEIGRLVNELQDEQSSFDRKVGSPWRDTGQTSASRASALRRLLVRSRSRTPRPDARSRSRAPDPSPHRSQPPSAL